MHVSCSSVAFVRLIIQGTICRFVILGIVFGTWVWGWSLCCVFELYTEVKIILIVGLEKRAAGLNGIRRWLSIGVY